VTFQFGSFFGNGNSGLQFVARRSTDHYFHLATALDSELEKVNVMLIAIVPFSMPPAPSL
jgi:hypothetical protein